MFYKISSTIQYPRWETERYKKLDKYDRLLDGTFYDHLAYAFYDELKPGTQDAIPIIERRPSAQFRLPRMVARWTSRKLFAGRHAPRVRHPDTDTSAQIESFLDSMGFWPTMLEAAYYGSVGAVAVTFRLNPEPSLKVWRAKYCEPTFSDDGGLTRLRIHYVTSAQALRKMGAEGLESNESYWFIRDYLSDREVTYAPVAHRDWNPVEGFQEEGKSLTEWKTYEHGLGFVPGHWFTNLAGGDAPDGACTWADAIPNSIEIDYTMSQMGRGVRYNAAPQLVIKGQVLNGDVVRGPMNYIHLEADKKSDDGSLMGSSASLLEMSGGGMEASLRLIDHLRNMALEQIAASRKDPEKLKGPMSGRAMEFLDEDSDDLVMELRSHYGDLGALPLIAKLIRATDGPETGNLSLHWPRLFQPTPDDLASMIPALVMAAKPLVEPQAAGADGVVPPVDPEQAKGLLSPEQARTYLVTNMDIHNLETDVGGEPPKETPPSPPSSDEEGGEAVEKVGPMWNIHEPIKGPYSTK